MGFKRTNYKVNGYIYPEVYAVFSGKIEKVGEKYRVYFNIHATRELAINAKPLEIKSIVVDWNRIDDIVKVAYAEAKKQIPGLKINEDTGMVEHTYVDGPFTSWEDDVQ